MGIDVETSLLWRLNGFLDFNGFLDSGFFSGFNRRQCVRDWSGILCERFRERGSGTGTRSLSLSKCRGLGKRDGNGASKDIAESPTALPERPDKV